MEGFGEVQLGVGPHGRLVGIQGPQFVRHGRTRVCLSFQHGIKASVITAPTNLAATLADGDEGAAPTSSSLPDDALLQPAL